MAASLMAAGFRVVGYDILSGADATIARQRTVVRNARELGRGTDVVICSLPHPDALLAVAQDLAASPRPPRIVIETSTLRSSVKQQARRLFARPRVHAPRLPAERYLCAQGAREGPRVYASGSGRPGADSRRCWRILAGTLLRRPSAAGRRRSSWPTCSWPSTTSPPPKVSCSQEPAWIPR